MAARFNPPPNWPAPPAGWTPPPGWTPDPAWGPAPAGWQLWVEGVESGPAPMLPHASGPTASGASTTTVPVHLGEPRAPRPWYKKKRFVIPGACLLLIIFVGALGSGTGSDPRTPVGGTAATQGAEQEGEKTAEEIAAEKEAADKAEAEAAAAQAEAERLAEEQRVADEAAAAQAQAAEAARVGTLSQQNAYSQASTYLGNLPFSREGLLDQLTSEYGGQFAPADAEFAIARLEVEGGVDWFAEAVEAAQSYQATIPMSRQGLIDQLTSQYGSQFPLDQATHAVDTLGL